MVAGHPLQEVLAELDMLLEEAGLTMELTPRVVEAEEAQLLMQRTSLLVEEVAKRQAVAQMPHQLPRMGHRAGMAEAIQAALVRVEAEVVLPRQVAMARA